MTRRILTPLFALLVFVAYLHCALEHGIACNVGDEGFAVQLMGSDAPVSSMPGATDDCGSSCICKGATLANHFVLAKLDGPSFDRHLIKTSSFVLVVAETKPRSDRFGETPIAIGILCAHARCAVLQVFLI